MYFTCRLLYESRMWSFWNNWFRSVRSYKRFTKGWIRTPSLTSAPIVGWMCLLPTYRKYAKRHWSDNRVCHIIVGSTKPEVCLAAPPPVSMVCLFVNQWNFEIGVTGSLFFSSLESRTERIQTNTQHIEIFSL